MSQRLNLNQVGIKKVILLPYAEMHGGLRKIIMNREAFIYGDIHKQSSIFISIKINEADPRGSDEERNKVKMSQE